MKKAAEVYLRAVRAFKPRRNIRTLFYVCNIGSKYRQVVESVAKYISESEQNVPHIHTHGNCIPQQIAKVFVRR